MFKFDEYPKIKECHEEYVRLSELASKASFKCDRCELSKEEEYMKNYLETERRLEEYSQSVYSKIIFETFNPIKPILRNVWEDNKKPTWDKVFGTNFDECNEDKRENLVGLVEDERPYMLPSEYYIGKSKVEMYLEMADMD